MHWTFFFDFKGLDNEVVVGEYTDVSGYIPFSVSNQSYRPFFSKYIERFPISSASRPSMSISAFAAESAYSEPDPVISMHAIG